MQKLIFPASALLAVAAIFPVRAMEAATPGWLPDDNSDARSLVDLERRWANSGCTGENLDAQIMAEGFLGTAPDGRRFKGSDEFDLDNTIHERGCRLDEAKVRLFRPDLAVVYGSERAVMVTKEGKQKLRCLVWTDTWIKQDGKWLLIAGQDGAVRCTQPAY